MSVHIPVPISFEWDKGNRDKNKIKHDVEMQECEEVFFDDPVYLPDRDHSHGESRYVALGKTVEKRYLFIVFTVRSLKVRVISARDQNKRERAYYKNQHKSI